MPQRRHALAVDATRCLSRIVQRDERVVIAAVAFGEVLRADVGRERPDVPRADAEDVLHGRRLPRPQGTLPTRSQSVTVPVTVPVATVCQAAASPCGRSF
jgi:hypothetical protein